MDTAQTKTHPDPDEASEHMDTSETSRPAVDEVDLLLANARLRDELEPYRDESIDDPSVTRMSLRTENEYLASMLAWERAPALPIASWFTPVMELPSPDAIDDELVHRCCTRRSIGCIRKRSFSVSPTIFPIANFTRSSIATSCPVVKRKWNCRASTWSGGASKTTKPGCVTTPTRSSVDAIRKSTTSTSRQAKRRSTDATCRADQPLRYFHMQANAANASRQPIFLPSS